MQVKNATIYEGSRSAAHGRINDAVYTQCEQLRNPAPIVSRKAIRQLKRHPAMPQSLNDLAWAILPGAKMTLFMPKPLCIRCRSTFWSPNAQTWTSPENNAPCYSIFPASMVNNDKGKGLVRNRAPGCRTNQLREGASGGSLSAS